MGMEEGLDTGPMLLIERVAIDDTDTTGSLHDKLAALGGRMIVEALRDWSSGNCGHAAARGRRDLCGQDQQGRSEARFHPARAVDLARKVRAFNPFPGAHGQARRRRSRSGMRNRSTAGPPGQVLAADAQGIVVACGRVRCA